MAVEANGKTLLVLTRDERRNLANALLHRLRLTPKIHSQGNAHRMIIFGPGRSRPLEPGTGYYALATKLEPKLPDMRHYAMLLTRTCYQRLYNSLSASYKFAWDDAVGERHRTRDELNRYIKQGNKYLNKVFTPLENPDGRCLLTPARNYSKAAIAGESMIEFAIELFNEDNPSITIVRLDEAQHDLLDMA